MDAAPPDLAPPRRRDRRARRDGPRAVDVDVVVIGAGRAGLTAANDLRRARFAAVGSTGWETAGSTFVVLDDNDGPGGSWRHRWPGLTMAAAHRVHTLPGMPLSVPDADAPASEAVPEYFAQYEDAFALTVQRPVRVDSVRREGDRLVVLAHHLAAPDEPVLFRARGVVNATGSWGRPFWPACPGREVFAGTQLHARDFTGVADLPPGHVVVVGGGSSAVQILAEVAEFRSTTWVTRHPPQIQPQDRTAQVQRATAAGVMVARPMFERMGAHGVWFAPAPADDGSAREGEPGQEWVDGPPFVAADVVIWATGFRPSVAHLAPLHLRGAAGPAAPGEPALRLVGSAAGAGCPDADPAVSDLIELLTR